MDKEKKPTQQKPKEKRNGNITNEQRYREREQVYALYTSGIMRMMDLEKATGFNTKRLRAYVRSIEKEIANGFNQKTKDEKRVQIVGQLEKQIFDLVIKSKEEGLLPSEYKALIDTKLSCIDRLIKLYGLDENKVKVDIAPVKLEIEEKVSTKKIMEVIKGADYETQQKLIEQLAYIESACAEPQGNAK